MLGRRELSEAQLRQRLARRHHDPTDIDAAIARLTHDGSLDDSRVAGIIARTEASRRGRISVRRRIEAAGVASVIAQRAVDEAFTDVDVDAVLEAALQRRLRGATAVENDRQFARLYRYLVGQGFDPDRVTRLLRRYRHTSRPG